MITINRHPLGVELILKLPSDYRLAVELWRSNVEECRNCETRRAERVVLRKGKRMLLCVQCARAYALGGYDE